MRVGNLDSTRDFLHVRDVAEAYIKLLAPSVPAQAYNVCTGRATRIGDVLDGLIAMSDKRISVETDTKRWRKADARVGDNHRLRETTGWEPRSSVAEILSELLEYWREQVVGASRADASLSSG